MEIGPGQRTQTILQRVTAARAAKLDEITAARLGELDAAKIPADIDTLLTRLSDTRAGYLDELGPTHVPADIDTLITRVTAARMAELDAGGIPTDVDTLLTRLNADRAGYLDQLDFALQEAIAALQTDLDNPAQYKADLSALETRLSVARAGYLDWLNIGETVPTQAQINAQVDGALNTAIPASPVADSVDERIKTLDDNYTTARAGKLDFLDALISSRSSHGPGDIWTQGTRVLTNPAAPSDLANMLAGISGTATGRAALLDQITAGRMGELDAANIPADIDTLITRVTTARMGELDAANLPADIDTLLSRITAAVALASVCSDVRLGELDAANMPTDLDTLITRVTAARMTELDAAYMPADLDTLIGRLTAVRAAYLDNLIGTQTANTYSHPSGTTEQDAVVITPAELGKYERLSLDMSNLAQNTTIRTHLQVDGTNYRQCDSAVFPGDFPTDTESVLIVLMPGLRNMKVTLQSAVAEGEAKNVAYFYVTRSLA